MLTKLDDLKRALGITTSDDDILLYDIIKRSWDKAEQHCRRSFESAERTEYYEGSGTDELLLNEYPITSLGDVYIDGDRDWTADTQVDSDNLYIDNQTPGVIRYKNNIFYTSWQQNVKVTYTAGFTASTLPADLDAAVINLAIAEFIRSKGSINAVEGGDDRPSQLKKEAFETLDKYVRTR